MANKLSPIDKLAKIDEIIRCYAQIDGSQHRIWVIDQIVRIMNDGDDEKYNKWVAEYEDGEDGPNTYYWDVGIAP